MSFDFKSFGLLYGGGDGSAKIHLYMSTDTIETVLVDGYFNDAINFIAVGDWIVFSSVDDLETASRTTASTYILTFDSISGGVVSAYLTTAAGDDVSTVADDLSGDNTIGTVATNIADVNTVAAQILSVVTVAADLDGSDTIGTVAGDLLGSDNIGSVAAALADIITANANISAITTVADDLNGDDDIGTCAAISVDISTLASAMTIAGLDTVTPNSAQDYMLVADGSDGNALKNTPVGTSATKDIGTSGDTVPTLDQDLVFSGYVAMSRAYFLVGLTTPYTTIPRLETSADRTHGVQIQSTGAESSSLALIGNQNSGNPTEITIARSRAGGALQDDDHVGSIGFAIHDGTQYLSGGGFVCVVDGTVGTDDVPSEIEIWTNPGAANPSMRGIFKKDGAFEWMSDASFDGDITVTGTVDGRDVASDGTKLDGVESGAQVNTVDSVAGKTGTVTLDTDDLSEGSNLFFTNARADARIAAASAQDLSDITDVGSGAIISDAERTKLSGIETGATADQTGAEIATSIDITGTTAAAAFGSGDEMLIFDVSAGENRKIDWDDLPGATGGLNNISEDTTPTLGGTSGS